MSNPIGTTQGAGGGAADGGITALTGDVTASGNGSVAAAITNNAVTSAKIVDEAVTFAKMQHIVTDSLLGRDTASDGDVENIGLNTTLEMASGSLRRAALTGDVTASAGNNVTVLANSGVTAANYGNATHSAQIAVDAKGRITSAANVAITVSGGTAATQAQMEAASDTTNFATPGRAHFHPGVAKAWVNFNGTGTVAIVQDYGVSSITDGGTGVYTVNFDTSFNDANYAVIAGVLYPDVAIPHLIRHSTKTSSACQIKCRNSANADSDISEVYLAFFGDFA